jgi:ATP-dependent Clp protease, protease subunit
MSTGRFSLYLLLLFTVNTLAIDKPVLIKLRPNNHVSLIGEVNTVSVNNVIDRMNIISKSNIWFYINSPGGFVEDGDKLISYMDYRQNSGTNITCIVETAHSMAFHIVQRCHLRLVTPSAKMMQHQISFGIQGELTKINSYTQMINSISERLSREAAERIGITLEEFTTKFQQDWWLYGQDIVKANVADGIALVGCEDISKIVTIAGKSIFKCPITEIPPLIVKLR